MKHNNLLILLIIGVITVISITSGPGCANIIPPTGGPRDSLPPVLVSVTPPDTARNFNAKRIVIEFNEFVDLDRIQENLLVSPLPKINPTVVRRLRIVTVTIKDTLEENTTYTIDFGNAIKDINEGNVLKNFTYLFSTGSFIDSMELTGKVIIAETGKTDSTLIVMLHTNIDDSAVINERPRYITRVDGNGNFHFHHLPPATYTIYALKDEGGQRKYLNPQQLFAFSDSAVTTQVTPEPITLYAYTEPDTGARATTTSLPRPGIGRNTQDRAANRLRIETNLSGGMLDLLDSLTLNFQTPLVNFDSSKVLLTNDNYDPLSGYYYIRDTSNKKFTLVYNWTPNTDYNLIFDTTFATDTSGRKLPRTDTLAFRTKKESDYGELRLRLLNLDLTKNPVLQFVQGDKVVHSHVLNGREYNVKLFKPGEYDLRILHDNNQNGVYDPGSFFGIHRQPEKVIPLSRKLTIKANWNNQVDITLE